MNLLSVMELIEHKMDRNRAEIEKLKIENWIIEARTAQNLGRLEEQINYLAKSA